MFTNVHDFKGKIEAEFKQEDLFRPGEGHNVCVPASVLWVLWSVGERAPRFPGFTKQDSARDLAVTIGKTMNRELDEPLTLWEQRRFFIEQCTTFSLTYERRKRPPAELPDWVIRMASKLLQTRPDDATLWPRELFSQKHRKHFMRLLEPLTKPPLPPRIRHWKRLLDYRFLDTSLALHSRELLSFHRHDNYTAFDRFIADLANSNGYKLVCLLTAKHRDGDLDGRVAGHMMAMHSKKNSFVIFDANAGVASFSSSGNFQKWLGSYFQKHYGKLLDRMFLKNFRRRRAHGSR